MENYKVIQDEKLFKEFIDWLPDCNEHEQYYVCLFARSKYSDKLVHIKSDKAQLKRFTTTKQRMYTKVKQLECSIGSYMQRDVVIPQEALALYISVNPRDLWKATFRSMTKLAKCIELRNIHNNPHQEVMSEIQKSRGTRYYVDIDLDSKEPEQLELMLSHINRDAVQILETRGGYHLLVKPQMVEPKYAKTWYKNMASMCDQIGDQMIPVPGCTQGNFTPHFI